LIKIAKSYLAQVGIDMEIGRWIAASSLCADRTKHDQLAARSGGSLGTAMNRSASSRVLHEFLPARRNYASATR